MRRLRSLTFALIAAGCVRTAVKQEAYPVPQPDSAALKKYQSANVPDHPPDTSRISLDRKTASVAPVDLNRPGAYAPAEPGIGRTGPQPVETAPVPPPIVIAEKKEPAKPPPARPAEEKPVELPTIVRGDGIVQSIALDRDTYRQGEVATLTVTALLPLTNARIDFLNRRYTVYGTAEKNVYRTVLAVPVETRPDKYEMKIYYDDGGAESGMRVPFTVIAGRFPQHDTARMDIPILTEETLEMLYYEGGYFGGAYRVNPDSLVLDPNFIWPSSGTLTGMFGGARKYNKGMDKWRHRGIDIAAVVGTPVLAPSDGIVAMAKNLDVHGRSIVIAHGGGVHTVFLHLNRMAVWPGMRVKKGQLIGYVGRSGLVTGPNLHWQVMVNGQATDPRSWVTGEYDRGRLERVESGPEAEAGR